MSAGDEIMMPVPKPEAVAMAEIHALRQISDALQTTNQNLTVLAADVKDVRERVIRIESQDMRGQIIELRGDLKAACIRIDALEATRDRQAGALSVGGWISKYAPWLVAIFMAGLAGLGIKSGAGS